MLIASLVAVTLVPGFAADIVIQPGDDFCAAFNQAMPGDNVLLAPGMHMGPCVLATSGAQGSPITLGAVDPGDPPQIVYGGANSNVFDVQASDIVVQDLRIGPSQPDIDGIKIKSGDRVTIAGCAFTGIGGISISANSQDSTGIVIRANSFTDLQATGVYLGCHDGMAACAASDVIVEANLFDGIVSPAVGYAMEIELDSFGVIRDNVMNDPQGPAIEVYGSTDLGRVTVVERNLVLRSGTSGTIEIGGGPAIVRNNIAVGGEAAAILVYDYGGRDLVRGIKLLGNTAIGETGPAFVLQSWAAGKDLELTANAAWHTAGGEAFPAPTDGVPTMGNVACPDPAACVLDPPGLDLWPVDGGPLVTMGATPVDPASLVDDFCGQTRGAVPHAGALEWTGPTGPGPFTVAFKRDLGCDALGGGETTGDPDTTAGTTDTGAGETGSAAATDGPDDGNEAFSGGNDTADDLPTSGGASDPTSGGTMATSLASTGDDAGNAEDGGSGCGCRGTPAGPGWLAGLLVLLRRRRACATIAA